jgi:hypothetical protein
MQEWECELIDVACTRRASYLVYPFFHDDDELKTDTQIRSYVRGLSRMSIMAFAPTTAFFFSFVFKSLRCLSL